MHAVLITFTSQVTPEDLSEGMSAYAEALARVPGFVSKAWLHDGSTLGGSYLFTTREAADAYLAGELVAGLRATPVFSEFIVRRYDVLADLSARTGVAEPAATR